MRAGDMAKTRDLVDILASGKIKHMTCGEDWWELYDAAEEEAPDDEDEYDEFWRQHIVANSKTPDILCCGEPTSNDGQWCDLVEAFARNVGITVDWV